ncbi:hypothetical protein [Arthrobacter caoxuetaonis]|uniref:Uncharacterized protein n=1 Tax=Arthrobacter caoxuetaonis TaxID=2886935 RepID=A0A9X1SED2_9MICC|nr:hypothetical protein [Arthrobacter caoxuetaonis]MCC3299727.1 hypothetical protein [Arthrobacter caoxuetaonis]USQ59371.1 hypothetical protein NF551_17640 [Arthrobacter caoxuetaonis]
MEWIEVSGFVVSLFLAVLAFLGFIRSSRKTRRHLMYSVHTKTFQGIGRVTRVAFMNVGKDDIVPGDFSNGLPLRIDLEVPITCQLGECFSYKANDMDLDVVGSCVSLKPTIIGPGSMIVGQFVTRGEPDPELKRTLEHIPVTSLAEARGKVGNWLFMVFTSLVCWFSAAIMWGLDSTENMNELAIWALKWSVVPLSVFFPVSLVRLIASCSAPLRFLSATRRALPALRRYRARELQADPE